MILLKGHASGTAVPMLAFAPDGRSLASVGHDHTVRSWDLAPGESRVVYRTRSRAVAFSPCGRWLVFGSYNETLRLRTVGGEPMPLGGEPSVPRALAFSPKGRLLAVGGHALELHDVRAWKQLPSPAPRALPRPSGEHLALAFRPDEKLLAVATRGEPRVALLDPRDPDLREEGALSGEGHSFTSLAFSPCGRLLAATGGPALRVWDVEARASVFREAVSSRFVQSCAFSPDGRLLAAAHNDALVRLYETDRWREVAAYDWGIGPVLHVTFAPDGMKAAVSSKRGLIAVWDVDE